MLNLSLKELKIKKKNRKINVYRSMSKDELLDMINRSEPIKNKRKGDKKSLFKSKR